MDSTLSKKSTNIYELYNSNNKDRIIKLISKMIINSNVNKKVITDIIIENKTDDKITNELSKINKNAENLYTEEHDFRRASYKWNVIKKNMLTPIRSIVDFGGNVGNTAYFIGRKILQLPKNKTMVVDIDEWSGEKWSPRSDITFINSNEMDKIPDNSVDIITAFHVLHHINSDEYKKIINDFFRILKKTGVIVLYEHDCHDDNDASFIDVEHALYDVVASKKVKWSEFIKTFYAKYLNKNDWKSLFEKNGFKLYSTLELHNLDNSFYMFFRKK